MYNIGDIVEIKDRVLPDEVEPYRGTIVYIEADNEIEDLYWIYIRALNESLNIYYHPAFGDFAVISEMNSPYITKVHDATIA